MKVRIGIGVAGDLAGGALGEVVDALDEARFDSIWLPEVLTAATPDPVAALAWVAARSPRLKLGTTCLVTGRNPLRLAKQLATVDALSGGRLLLTLVPGLAHQPERGAIGGDWARRGAAIDEVLPLLRRLWAGEEVTHHGRAADLDGVRLSPLPTQEPLEPWLGGSGPAALRRCGRLADGWLPAMCTPVEAAAGRQVIEEAADEVGRTIDAEHFGVSIAYATEPLSDRERAALAGRRGGREDDLAEVVPVGHEALRSLLEAFIAAGSSKFVLRPLRPPADWRAELSALAGAVGDLQT